MVWWRERVLKMGCSKRGWCCDERFCVVRRVECCERNLVLWWCYELFDISSIEYH